MSDISRRIAGLSPEKQALLAERLRGKGQAPPNAEPLAIVGLGCRFPGGGDSSESFWELLASGRDAVAEVPAERWDGPAMFDTDLTRPGKIASRWGTWLDRLDEFDSQFFGIAPREAVRTDPQQRLLLEVCWEALEDAGIRMDTLAGSRTGVYVGTHGNDFSWMTFEDPSTLDAYSGTGTAHSIVANRVSYLFDLRGPSIAVDTACSSSLVAVHLACQGVRSGDCDRAIAAGVNLMLTPLWAIVVSKLGMLSPDGRCKAFDERANGIVRGEGCGVVVIRRLSEALRDGDRIWAVIRGTAANQDGRTNGITAPNGLSQQDVVRSALENAGLSPDAISAIEAHGTGTALGDPIEVEALTEVLGRGDPVSNPCMLGSVKTNIGHLEGAAGIAGLIRLVLSLHHEQWPGLVSFDRLNPHISLEGTRFIVTGKTLPWPRGERPRYGGVSAFGFGGTNAHIVVQEAPLPSPPSPSIGESDSHIHVLPLSARNPEALRARAAAVRDGLRRTDTGPALYDLCYSATFRRSLHEHIAGVAGRTRDEIAGRLDAFAGGATPFGVFSGKRDPSRVQGLAYVFSGQGSQWLGMGVRLARTEAVFGDVLARCDALIREDAGWSLTAELERPSGESRLQETEVAQPAIFAVQVALAAWLESVGVRPEAVAGHSVGEVAAAYVGGILTLPEAIRVIVRRARLMQRGTGAGKMLSVERPAAALDSVIKECGGELSLAAVNSPTSCVLSGDAGAVQRAAEALERQGAMVRFLPVDYAFHSPQMEPFARELETVLAGLRPVTAKIPFVSTVTGRPADGETGTAAYWRRNVREPVRFADAVAGLARLGCRTFLEIGPHPVLARSLRQCCDDMELEGAVVGTLQREQAEDLALATTLTALHLLGYRPKLDRYFPARGRVVSLPSYPWQRQKYPLKGAGKGRRRRIEGTDFRSSAPTLLGSRLDTAIRTFEVAVSADETRWLADHRMNGQAIVPAAALIGFGLEAAKSVFGAGGHAVGNLIIEKPIVVPEGEERLIQVAITTDGPDSASMNVFSRPGSPEGGEDAWSLHASAQLTRQPEKAGTSMAAAPDEEVLRAGCDKEVSPDRYYARLASLGADFGPSFRSVEQLWVGVDSASGLVAQTTDRDSVIDASFIAPGVLDGILQVSGAMLHDPEGDGRMYMPVSFLSVRPVRSCSGRLRVRSDRRPGRKGEAVVDVSVYDENGDTVLEIGGIHFRSIEKGRDLRGSGEACPAFYSVNWRPDDGSDKETTATGDVFSGKGSWLVLGDPDSLGSVVAEGLEKAGAKVALAKNGSGWAVAGPHRYTVDACGGDDLGKLLREGCPGEGGWAGVVHLLSVPGPGTGADGGPSPVERIEVGSRSLLAALQALSGLRQKDPPRLFVVTRGGTTAGDDGAAVDAAQAPTWGLARVIALEHPEVSCTCIDLDPSPAAEVVPSLLGEFERMRPGGEIAFRHGVRHVPRLEIHRDRTSPDETPRRLEKGSAGVLDDLKWVPIRRRAPAEGEVELRVLAAGLNFRDVLNALGMYPGDPVPLGNECVGEVVGVGGNVPHLRVGDLAVGVAFGSIATHVTTSATLFVRAPNALAVADAATIPIAFLTAYLALTEIARLRRGDRVLIHAAAGGVGLAAVQLAVRAGAEVIATAGSPAKREFLRRLGVRHVFDSRTTGFAEGVEAALGGRSIDVVLNSLTGDFIPKSLQLLAPGGRFLEIGKRGIWSAEDVESLRPDVEYHVVYLGEVCVEEPRRVERMLNELASCFGEGTLKPLPVAVYEAGRAVDAFRFMAQARHIGKIVVTFPEAFDARVSPEPVTIRADATYLVTGGWGGLGRVIVEGLVDRGARSVVLTGRTAPSPATAEALEELARKGAKVHVIPADVSDLEAMRAVFGRIRKEMPALRGVVHAAGIIDDGPLLQQDWTRFSRVMAPKVAGTWNLHHLCSEHSPEFLVLFSSIAGLIGWPGQGSYAAGNAFLDAFAKYRRALGLPALSIDWGTWGESGMAASLPLPHRERLRRWGMAPMSPSAGWRAFEKALGITASQVAVMDVDWRAFKEACASERLKGLVGEVCKADAGMSTAALDAERPFLRELAETPRAKRRAFIQSRVKALALVTLGLAPTFSLDLRQGLRDVGLDSLMAVELRNALSRMVGNPLPSTLLFDYPTVEALTGYLSRETATGEESGTAPDGPGPGPGDALGELSEDEAESLLREELSRMQGRPRTGD